MHHLRKGKDANFQSTYYKVVTFHSDRTYAIFQCQQMGFPLAEPYSCANAALSDRLHYAHSVWDPVRQASWHWVLFFSLSCFIQSCRWILSAAADVPCAIVTRGKVRYEDAMLGN